MTAKHFGIMECAFFNRHGYAGVGPAYVDVGKEGVEWGLKGGRSFSLRQSCNTHTHTHVFQREMGWGQGVWHSGGVCWCVLNSLIYVREQAFVFIPWMWLKSIFVPVRLMCVSALYVDVRVSECAFTCVCPPPCSLLDWFKTPSAGTLVFVNDDLHHLPYTFAIQKMWDTFR